MNGEHVGLHIGVVTDRDDPLGLGRVRLSIPGLIEPESNWAYPLGGAGGGSQDRGLFAVPRVGAEVGVFFASGRLAHPFYLAAHWGIVSGRKETPPEASTDRTVLSTETFSVTLDETRGAESVRITNRRNGDAVELSATKHDITIRGTARITLQALGEVRVQAPLITLGSRVVRPVGEPI